MEWSDLFEYAGDNMDYIAPVAGGVANYFTQRNASRDQADALRNGMNQSTQAQTAMYNQMREDTAPQRALFGAVQGNLLNAPNLTANLGAYGNELNELQQPTMGNLDDDPIYQAQKAELLRTLGRRSAAQGKYNSSDADNAITRNMLPFMQDSYGRSVGDYNRNYQNVMGRYGINSDVNNTRYGQILDMAKIGSGAAASAGQNAMALGGNLGNTYQYGNNALGTTAYNAGQNTAGNINETIGGVVAARNNSELMNLLQNGNYSWLNSPSGQNMWGPNR